MPNFTEDSVRLSPRNQLRSSSSARPPLLTAFTVAFAPITATGFFAASGIAGMRATDYYLSFAKMPRKLLRGTPPSRRGNIRCNIFSAGTHPDERANHQVYAHRVIGRFHFCYSGLARPKQSTKLRLGHSLPRPLFPYGIRQPQF